jgi:hypothetical protein
VRDRTDAVALALGGVSDGPGGAGPAGLTLHDQARLVGGYQWVERRLFEVLGAWVGSEPVPEAQVLYDVYSQQHAWHAELLAERLPVLDSLDPATLTVPPDAEVDRTLGLLAGTVSDQGAVGGEGAGGPGAPPRGTVPAGGTLLRLVGLGRVVLPRLVAGYNLHLRRLSSVADAPVGRCLRLVRRDELEQWQAIEALTQSLLRRPHDIAVVTAHQQLLEELLAGSGAGLVPWPEAPATPGPPADDPGPGSQAPA